ncbi:transmembrane protein 81 [Menidia menidia]
MRLYFILLPLFILITSTDLSEVDEVPVEVIAESSPCSATCGLGIKTQTLCLLKDSKTALEDQAKIPPTQQVISKESEDCRVRKVRCLESWQCGLTTMTVMSGQKVEIDCLGEVMEAMGRFSWRVSWRYARGIITSDDSFFQRWEAPHLDRVVMESVREEDAGTYRCDVQDTSLRRVKRIYWGVRVLPLGVLSLDLQSSVARKEKAESPQKTPAVQPGTTGRRLLYAVGVSLVTVGIWAGLLGLYRRRMVRVTEE